MNGVEDFHREAAGAASAGGGDLAGHTDGDQRRRHRGPGVRLDRKRRTDQRGGGATHRGDPRHQRIAVGDGGDAPGIANHIALAGEPHDGALALGEARQRRVIGFAAGQRAELGAR